jgi:hypothetical protein
MDNDGIEVLNICHKNILHIFEQPDRKGTGEVRIHGSGVGIGKRGKAETSCMLQASCWGII